MTGDGTDTSGVSGSPVVLTVQNVEYRDNLKPQSGNTYEPTNMLDGSPHYGLGGQFGPSKL